MTDFLNGLAKKSLLANLDMYFYKTLLFAYFLQHIKIILKWEVVQDGHTEEPELPSTHGHTRFTATYGIVPTEK